MTEETTTFDSFLKSLHATECKEYDSDDGRHEYDEWIESLEKDHLIFMADVWVQSVLKDMIKTYFN